MAGGGIGEAALIGAALGGASSAIQGGNPLEGALLGGVTGGVGGAFSGAGAGAAESFIPSVAETAGTQAFAIPEAEQFALRELPNAVNPITTQAATFGAPSLPSGMYDYLGGASTQPFQDTSLSFMSALPVPPTPPSYIEQAPVAAGADATQQAAKPGIFDKVTGWAEKNPLQAGMLGIGALSMLSPQQTMPGQQPYQSTFDRTKFKPSLPQNAVYQPRYADGGGISNLSGNDDYQSDGVYNSPIPMASGGIASLGGYSDGGRMLKGPGDGMSDDIPATIEGKHPARLADGEFVVPADVVSHLGNGSTDAGSKQLYAMMDKVRHARTGSKKQGKQINPGKYLPA